MVIRSLESSVSRIQLPFSRITQPPYWVKVRHFLWIVLFYTGLLATICLLTWITKSDAVF